MYLGSLWASKLGANYLYMTHVVHFTVVVRDCIVLLHSNFSRLDNATLASFYRGTNKEQRSQTDEHI